MKLAGEFEFLGDAFRGDPQFDAPPPKGVVKLYYLNEDASGDDKHEAASKRCGFFECPWWRWGAFKEAATRHLPGQVAQGIFPVAFIVARAPDPARAVSAVPLERGGP
jgi:hypothetical protein